MGQVVKASPACSFLILIPFPRLINRPPSFLSLQEAIQLDGEILFSLLQRVSPLAYKHLSKQKIDPILYMTEWFMCAFSRTLPWSSVLRVWDMFFCEGTGWGQAQGEAAFSFWSFILMAPWQ